LTFSASEAAHAAGDTALVEGQRGPLPGVAPVAKQQGAHVARVIAARLGGRPTPGPFRSRMAIVIDWLWSC
jgi:NADH:ubiquinone reductase (H+-translocating)